MINLANKIRPFSLTEKITSCGIRCETVNGRLRLFNLLDQSIPVYNINGYLTVSIEDLAMIFNDRFCLDIEGDMYWELREQYDYDMDTNQILPSYPMITNNYKTCIMYKKYMYGVDLFCLSYDQYDNMANMYGELALIDKDYYYYFLSDTGIYRLLKYNDYLLEHIRRNVYYELGENIKFKRMYEYREINETRS